MTALILKDCYTIKKMGKFLVILLVAFSLIPSTARANYAILYCGLLPITALAYDDRAKWDELAAMMPFSVKQIVVSKYLFGYAAIAAAVVVNTVIQVIAGLFTVNFMQEDLGVTLYCSAVASCLILAVSMPLLFRFGVEKGRLVFFLIGGLAAGFIIVADRWFDLIRTSNLTVLTPAIAAIITVILNVLSILVSIAWYRRRRGLCHA